MSLTLEKGGRTLQLKALQAVEKRLRFYGRQTEIIHPEWQGGKIDVLTTVLNRFGDRLDPCMGEYFFKPVTGEPEDGQYFCVVLTLENDFPMEQVPELAFALSILNFYIETGCFALNKPTNLLVFRCTRTFSGDTPEETLLRECVLLMEEAHEIAEKYCQPVFGLAEGTMTLKEFMKVLQPNG